MADLANISRRDVLVSLAMGTAVALLDAPRMLAQGPAVAARTSALRGRIDVHFHLGGTGGFGGGGNTAAISAAARASVEDLDCAGTAAGIISASSSGAGTGSLEQRNRQAREFNDTAARWCSDHPTRFGLWTRLPLTDVDASLKETSTAWTSSRRMGSALSPATRTRGWVIRSSSRSSRNSTDAKRSCTSIRTTPRAAAARTR